MSMLRNLRERKGLTVSQLAAKSSISSRVILDYEEGRQSISLAHAKLLARALWVGIEDLMPPTGATPPQAVAAASASPRPTPVSAAPPALRPQATAIAPPVAPPSYRPPQEPLAPVREASRTARPVSSDRPTHSVANAGGSSGRSTRPSRPAPPPPGPITEGQLDELRRLAAKLEITEEQLEERIGKQLAELNRPEAKDWIKRARGMVEELMPSRKAPYGQWPEAREDQEAAYLKSHQEAGSYFVFRLFNSEQFGGTITDFTPYTITIKQHGNGDEVVLRKLAIAYYRRTEAPPDKTAEKPADGAKPTRTRARRRAAEERHQPLDDGLDSDRAGEPVKPETDNMDEDRGV
jgi:transcriptional regulator with XRE-family HTH domain